MQEKKAFKKKKVLRKGWRGQQENTLKGMSRRETAQTEAAKKNKRSKLQKRGRGEEEAHAKVLPMVVADSADAQEREKKWFSEQLRKRLARTQRVLVATGSEDNVAVDELAQMCGLENVLEALGGEKSVPAVVFRGMFSEAKWAHMKASQECLAKNSGEVRALQLSRQVGRLVEMQKEFGEDAEFEPVAKSMDATRQLMEALSVRQVTEVATFNKEKQKKAKKKRVPKEVQEEATAGREERPRRNTRKRLQDESQEEEVASRPRRETRSRTAEPARAPVAPVFALAPISASAEPDGVIATAPAQKESTPEGSLEEKEKESDVVGHLKHALALAEGEVDDVVAMVDELRRKGRIVLQLDGDAVVVPDLALASDAFIDNAKLLQWLQDEEGAVENGLETWGRLLSWFRDARKALGIASIFSFLKKKKGGTLQEKYEIEMERVKDEGVPMLSFTQANRYDRLGRFLVRFPRFMFQTRLASLSEWLQSVEYGKKKKGARQKVALMGALEELLTPVQLEFWKRPVREEMLIEVELPESVGDEQQRQQHFPVATIGEGVVLEQCCFICQMAHNRARLWSCSECKKLFHEMCAGYNESTACENVVLPGGVELTARIYCGGCLGKLGLTPDDVMIRMRELRGAEHFLGDVHCPFVLKRVPEDGFCCFGILEQVACDHLGWKKSRGTFCRELADRTFTAAQRASVIAGRLVKDASTKALMALKNAKGNGPEELLVNGEMWKQIEPEHVFEGFCAMFRVKVNVFQAADHRQSRTFSGEEGDVAEVEVDLLQWSSTAHFDKLERK